MRLDSGLQSECARYARLTDGDVAGAMVARSDFPVLVCVDDRMSTGRGCTTQVFHQFIKVLRFGNSLNCASVPSNDNRDPWFPRDFDDDATRCGHVIVTREKSGSSSGGLDALSGVLSRSPSEQQMYDGDANEDAPWCSPLHLVSSHVMKIGTASKTRRQSRLPRSKNLP